MTGDTLFLKGHKLWSPGWKWYPPLNTNLNPSWQLYKGKTHVWWQKKYTIYIHIYHKCSEAALFLCFLHIQTCPIRKVNVSHNSLSLSLTGSVWWRRQCLYSAAAYLHQSSQLDREEKDSPAQLCQWVSEIYPHKTLLDWKKRLGENLDHFNRLDFRLFAFGNSNTLRHSCK